jgi:predicted DNA-binding WGR domain protein
MKMRLKLKKDRNLHKFYSITVDEDEIKIKGNRNLHNFYLIQMMS